MGQSEFLSPAADRPRNARDRAASARFGWNLVIPLLGSLVLANCTVGGALTRMVDPKYGVPASPRVVEEGRPIPRGGGVYRVGNPYTIAGRTYVPEVNPDYRAEGIASWYGRDFHGRRTANGEIYDMNAISAAHPTLPIPSYVRVTNLSNRRSLVVRVNDRGPFKDNRVIDLSSKSAELLGFRSNGLARVRVEYVGRASTDGSDDRRLLATLRHDGQPAPAPSAVMVASTGGPFVPAPDQRVVPQRVAEIPSPADRPFSAGRPAPAMEAPGMLASNTGSQPRPAFVSAGTAPSATPVSFSGSAVVSGRGLY